MLVDEAELVECQKKLAEMTVAKNKAVDELKRQLVKALERNDLFWKLDKGLDRSYRTVVPLPTPTEEPRYIREMRSVITELEEVGL